MFSMLRKETNPDVDKERRSYGPSASLFISLKSKCMVSLSLKYPNVQKLNKSYLSPKRVDVALGFRHALCVLLGGHACRCSSYRIFQRMSFGHREGLHLFRRSDRNLTGTFRVAESRLSLFARFRTFSFRLQTRL